MTPVGYILVGAVLGWFGALIFGDVLHSRRGDGLELPKAARRR